MSHLTEIAAIITGFHEDSKAFEDLVEKYEGFRPEPVRSQGPNEVSISVYCLGLDYCDVNLIHGLMNANWHFGSTIWIESESDARPWIRISGPSPLSGWGCIPRGR